MRAIIVDDERLMIQKFVRLTAGITDLNIVGMFDPPIFPKGPGWTDGEMNNDLMPFAPLKQMKVTTVSMDSPMFSKVVSNLLDPSFMCMINKLNKSSIPIPKFFFKGEAAIEINA